MTQLFSWSACLISCFLPTLASAAIYNCTTEFGEAVPLGLSVSRAGEPSPDISKAWNTAVRKDPNLTSKIKSEERISGADKAVFEWRYAKRPGPPFTIEVQCPATGKCSGKFKDANDPSTLILETKLYDQRFPTRRGYAQLQLGDREELALRIRVFKETGDGTGSAKRTLSSSGEHMILGPEPRFIIDVGVDEHLELAPGFEHRLAALEIKVRCKL